MWLITDKKVLWVITDKKKAKKYCNFFSIWIENKTKDLNLIQSNLGQVRFYDNENF